MDIYGNTKLLTKLIDYESFYVKEIISFGEFESPEVSKVVSDYYHNEEDAIKFMKEHFPKHFWDGSSWETVYVASKDLEIK